MLIPLGQFFCDTCRQVIEKPSDGWIEWLEDFNEQSKKSEIHSFRIVHHMEASPLADKSSDGCYQHGQKPGRSDIRLNEFIREDYKMAYILHFLDAGEILDKNYHGCSIRDMRQYVNTVRRLTIPYFEEARKYWGEAQADGYFGDANDLWIYGTENLKQLIEKYGDN